MVPVNYKNFGLRLWGAWKRFAASRNGITDVAVNYGTSEAEFSEQHLRGWKAELRRLTGARSNPAVVLKDNKGYRSPLDPYILEGWIHRASDPEKQVVEWIRDGAPLGIERPILTSGIFPPSGEVPEGLVESDSVAQLAMGPIANYSSVNQHLDHAEEELSRLEKMGYMFRENKAEIEKNYGHGTISKLGLILKQKEDGSLKKRLVIDLVVVIRSTLPFILPPLRPPNFHHRPPNFHHRPPNFPHHPPSYIFSHYIHISHTIFQFDYTLSFFL